MSLPVVLTVPLPICGIVVLHTENNNVILQKIIFYVKMKEGIAETFLEMAARMIFYFLTLAEKG